MREVRQTDSFVRIVSLHLDISTTTLRDDLREGRWVLPPDSQLGLVGVVLRQLLSYEQAFDKTIFELSPELKTRP